MAHICRCLRGNAMHTHTHTTTAQYMRHTHTHGVHMNTQVCLDGPCTKIAEVTLRIRPFVLFPHDSTYLLHYTPGRYAHTHTQDTTKHGRHEQRAQRKTRSAIRKRRKKSTAVDTRRAAATMTRGAIKATEETRRSRAHKRRPLLSNDDDDVVFARFSRADTEEVTVT